MKKTLLILLVPVAALLLLGFGGGPVAHRPSTGGGGGATDWTQGAPTIYNDGPIGIGNDPQPPACIDALTGDLIVDDDIAVNGDFLAFGDNGVIGNCADGTGDSYLTIGLGPTAGLDIGAQISLGENAGSVGFGSFITGQDDESYLQIQANNAGGASNNRLYIFSPEQTQIPLPGAFHFSTNGVDETEPWIFVGAGLDVMFDGDTADGLYAQFGAATGLAAAMKFRLPPDQGNVGDVLTSDSVGNTYWAAPGASAWAAGVNGLFYNGDGVIVGGDVAFCAADGGAGDLRVADDLEVAGGNFWYCADMEVTADTADGADDMRVILNGGGAQSTARGATFVLSGNEHALSAGRAVLSSGDTGAIAGVDIIATKVSSGPGVRLFAEDGATDNLFQVSANGFSFSGNATDDVKLEEDIDVILEGDVDDANETTLRAANGLAGDTTFGLPGTNGSSGDVLTGDGAGQSSWTTAWANGSATIDFAATTGTTADSADIAVTGADTEDICVVSAGTAAYVAGASFTCYVASAGNVKVRFTATGNLIDPASATFNVRVFDP